MKKIASKLLAVAAMLSGLTASAQPYMDYYSRPLVVTNFTIKGATNLAGAVATNLVSANYDQVGPYVSTHGISPNNPEATWVTFQLVSHQAASLLNTNLNVAVETNQLSVSLAPILDDYSLSARYASAGGFERAATNQAFTLTLTAANTTNQTTYMTYCPGTNFLGARYFKAWKFSYIGSNNLVIDSFRAGYWH